MRKLLMIAALALACPACAAAIPALSVGLDAATAAATPGGIAVEALVALKFEEKRTATVPYASSETLGELRGQVEATYAALTAARSIYDQTIAKTLPGADRAALANMRVATDRAHEALINDIDARLASG